MKREFRLGPGAASLILIMLVLCMTILGALALATARADLRLSKRGAEMALGYYEAAAEGERRLAALCELLETARAGAKDDAEYLAAAARALPEDCEMTDRRVTFSVDAKAARSLVYEAEICPFESPDRVILRARALTDESEWADAVFEENVW